MAAAFGRIRRFCLFVARPLRSARAAHGWINLIPGAVVVVGLIAGAVSGLVGSPTAVIVYVLVFFIAIFGWAAWRLFVRVEELAEPPSRPANWEALIRKAKRWEAAASRVSSDHYVRQVLRKERPSEIFRPEPETSSEYDEALEELDTEVAIAGGTLAPTLLLALARAQHEIRACRYDLSEHDETKCKEIRSVVYESIRTFVKQLSD